MQKIDPAKIANDVKTLIEKRATLKQMKGVTNDELEAVYSLAFGYYQTGKYEEAHKLFQFLVLFDHLNAKYWFGLGATQQALRDFQNAAVSYGYCSFLKLDNPKPQLHAAECFLALGDKRSALATSFKVVLAIAWEHSAILTSNPEILAFADEMASLIWSSFACSSARCAFSLATCSRWSTPSCTARSMACSSAEICRSSAVMRPSDAVFSDR